MAPDNSTYVDRLTTLQNEIAEFPRTFETIQENLRLGAVAESQVQMVAHSIRHRKSSRLTESS